jgi:hypothetical protein
MGWQRIVSVGLLSVGMVTVAGRTQQVGAPQAPGLPPSATQPQTTEPFNKGDEFPTHTMAEKQQKWRNEERQQKLVADTDKLLLLATQLHDDVTKTNKNILSLDVVRRADEIEKLAHSVKEREKD